MATIRTYTTIEQSRKLAEILPLESADFCYIKTGFTRDNWMGVPEYQFKSIPYNDYSGESIGCWSLAALLNVIPKHIKDYNVLRIDISENDFAIWYDEIGYGVNNDLPNITMESAVDTCYEMILKLHELKML